MPLPSDGRAEQSENIWKFQSCYSESRPLCHYRGTVRLSNLKIYRKFKVVAPIKAIVPLPSDGRAEQSENI